jgi:hypothetical protein
MEKATQKYNEQSLEEAQGMPSFRSGNAQIKQTDQLRLPWPLAGPSWQGTFLKSHESNNLCDGQLVPSSVAGQ